MGRAIVAEVRDAAGNLTTDAGRTITFSKTSGTGTVSGLGTQTTSAGVASKTVTGVLVGSITITASDGSLTDGTTTFTVDVGAASKIVITSSTAN